MAQFELIKNTLKIRVKKSPLFVRAVILVFAIAFFTFPLIGLLLSISEGPGFHFGFLIGIFIFGFLGFYFLRLFLWNSFGMEIIVFNDNKVSYEADYRWFKSGIKTEEVDAFVFSANQVGYEDEQIATLVIGENSIVSVIKMPLDELQTLIQLLEKQAQGQRPIN